VPIEHSKVFKFFLKKGGKIFATVTDNKFFNIIDGIYKLRSDQPNTHRLTDIRDISLGNVY
jgi:hypothetical protein